MANVIQTAKSGNKWTRSDLAAYNIVVENVDVSTFFGAAQSHLPPPEVSSTLSSTTSSDPPVKLAKMIDSFSHTPRAHLRSLVIRLSDRLSLPYKTPLRDPPSRYGFN
jgi:hypothetical protein